MQTAELWTRYVTFLREHVPAAHGNLAPGASEERIEVLERTIGCRLPEPVKVVWRMNDGQRVTMLSNQIVEATPCIPTLSFLSTAMVAQVWLEWDQLRRLMRQKELEALHGATRSLVPGVIKPLYSSPLWIPLWADPVRPDYLGIDFDPDEAGRLGQIINFGRNEDDHFQAATDFDDLLVCLVAEVESGRWRASAMGFGDRVIPWFGDPRAHFFNALHGRWQRRNPRRQTAP
jgi:cell wall assembly regulator SMI1